MKTFFSFLVVMMITSTAQAWLAVDEPSKTYAFQFKMNSEVYEYTQKAASYEDAFDKAAQACFKHFKQGQRVSESRGLDIIDVCANPRKI